MKKVIFGCELSITAREAAIHCPHIGIDCIATGRRGLINRSHDDKYVVIWEDLQISGRCWEKKLEAMNHYGNMGNWSVVGFEDSTEAISWLIERKR